MIVHHLELIMMLLDTGAQQWHIVLMDQGESLFNDVQLYKFA